VHLPPRNFLSSFFNRHRVCSTFEGANKCDRAIIPGSPNKSGDQIKENRKEAGDCRRQRCVVRHGPEPRRRFYKSKPSFMAACVAPAGVFAQQMFRESTCQDTQPSGLNPLEDENAKLEGLLQIPIARLNVPSEGFAGKRADDIHGSVRRAVADTPRRCGNHDISRNGRCVQAGPPHMRGML